MTAVVGVSHGHLEISAVEHWIRSLRPVPVLACTHLVREPFRHVAISLTGAGRYVTGPSLAPAAAAAAAGRSGRAVIFPGSAELTGTLTVGEVLARTAIDRVEVLGGGPADDAATLDTRDFVRPQFRDGELVLTVLPAAGGVFVPFETREPTPCCASH